MIDGKKLITILFDCIKRRTDFSTMVSEFLKKKSDFKIT